MTTSMAVNIDELQVQTQAPPAAPRRACVRRCGQQKPKPDLKDARWKQLRERELRLQAD